MGLDFERVAELSCGKLCFEGLDTLQINVGNRCNLRCRHCHVGASPEGDKIMSRDVIDKIVGFLDGHNGVTADITGGCPELNPDFKFLMKLLCTSDRQVIVRTNLSVFFEPGMEWIPQWYRDHNVTIIASLPCYTKETVDSQRGDGVFDKCMRAIGMLNELGYGRDGVGELDLVYNPGGAFLPGDQSKLEIEYKKHLLDEHGITFDSLLTITNCPIGRFAEQLTANGELENYLKLLAGSFNEAAAKNVMCRQLLSVDYKGIIYNCDFNQALNMPVTDTNGKLITIDNLDKNIETPLAIKIADHCFSCTAGAGSSCTGTTI
jgi:radical SAM/Cys-rich protein